MSQDLPCDSGSIFRRVKRKSYFLVWQWIEPHFRRWPGSSPFRRFVSDPCRPVPQGFPSHWSDVWDPGCVSSLDRTRVDRPVGRPFRGPSEDEIMKKDLRVRTGETPVKTRRSVGLPTTFNWKDSCVPSLFIVSRTYRCPSGTRGRDGPLTSTRTG